MSTSTRPAPARGTPVRDQRQRLHVLHRRVEARAARVSLDDAHPSSQSGARKAALTGSILGAAGLITGSTVGAGILALPATTQSTGFYPSTALLLGSWAVLQLEALLIAEVNLRCHGLAASQPGETNRVIPLTEMVRMTVGPVGEAAASSVYLTMAFTLLLAYTSRAGELLDAAVPLSLGAALFTGTVGTVVATGGTSAAERLNSALTVLLLALFAGIIGSGAAQVDWAAGFPHADWSGCAQTLPVMFLALVYHDLIPVVCQYLGFDRRRIVPALLAGSVVPLGMFVAWQAVCLGLVPYTPGSSADPLDVLIASQGAIGGSAIALFSVAALMTSAIGTTLSLSSFFKNKLSELTTLDQVQLPRPSGGGGARSRQAPNGQHQPSVQHCAALLLTLVPPTAASMASTDIFMTATHLAGAYGMTLLYGLMPPVLAWAAREEHGTQKSMLGGGRPLLLGLGCAGIVVGALQLQQDLPGSSTAAAVSSAVQPVFEVASALPAASDSLRLHVSMSAGQLVSSFTPMASSVAPLAALLTS